MSHAFLSATISCSKNSPDSTFVAHAAALPDAALAGEIAKKWNEAAPSLRSRIAARSGSDLGPVGSVIPRQDRRLAAVLESAGWPDLATRVCALDQTPTH